MLKKSNRIFLDLENVDQNLFCSICYEVFQDPCTLSCSHTFCYGCILQQRLIRRSCPLCRNKQLIFNPQKDMQIAYKINFLRSKCSHQNCKWTGRYYQLKSHQRGCEFKPHKEQKIIDLEIINVINDDQNEKKVPRPSQGRKRIKVDRKEYYEIYYQLQPQRQQGNCLLPPTLSLINIQRPVQRRFFERQESLVPRAQIINGTLQNPIVVDIQDNQNTQNQNPNSSSPLETTKDRSKKLQKVQQSIEKVMTRSQQKKYCQRLRFLLE